MLNWGWDGELGLQGFFFYLVFKGGFRVYDLGFVPYLLLREGMDLQGADPVLGIRHRALQSSRPQLQPPSTALIKPQTQCPPPPPPPPKQERFGV